MHASSAGEAQTALPFVSLLKSSSRRPCVLSVTDPSGFSFADKLMGSQLERISYSLWDAPQYAARALDCFRPKAYVVIDLWRGSQLSLELKRRDIPIVFLNGALSPQQFKRRQRIAPFWRKVYSCADIITVQTEQDRDYFSALGVSGERIHVTGDCRTDAVLLRRTKANSERWHYMRPTGSSLFVAGSIHPLEVEAVLSAFLHVRKAHTRARLMLVPRYPEMAPSLAEKISHLGIIVKLFSKIENRDIPWDVAVVDRMGILFDLYSAADSAFVGDSLIPKGGHNIIEPMAFGIQVTHGPSMFCFKDSNVIDGMGTTICVQNAEELADAWLRAMQPEEKARAKKATQNYFKSQESASIPSWELIKKFLI